MSVDYFRSNECKSPGDFANAGILILRNMISQQSRIRVAASCHVIGGMYDVIEWS